MRMRPRPEKAPVVQEPKEKSRWRIPLGWLKEESFYRDIASKVLAVMVVALPAYVYAVATGHLASPSGKSILMIGLLAAAMILAIAAVSRLIDHGLSFWAVVYLALAVGLGISTFPIAASLLEESPDVYEPVRWFSGGMLVVLVAMTGWFIWVGLPKIRKEYYVASQDRAAERRERLKAERPRRPDRRWWRSR
jgi:hypothetical protein